MDSRSSRLAGLLPVRFRHCFPLFGAISILLPFTAGAAVTKTGDFYGSPSYTSTWVGNSGTSTLQVDGGSNYTTNALTLGYYAGANGTLTVTGTGTTLNTSQSVTVGYQGAGVLNIQAGAVMTSTGSSSSPSFYGIQIGNMSGASGTVTVDGVGSQWNIPNLRASIGISNGSSGSLNIQNGGTVNFGTGGVNVSNGGSLLVTGTGSTLNMLSSIQFNVGGAAAATATISAGGVINSAGANAVGWFLNQPGSMTVTGAGSQYNVAGTFILGNSSGTGTFTVSDGALFSVSQSGTPNSSGTGFQSLANDGVITIAGTPQSSNPGTPPSQGTLNIGAYDLSAPTTSGIIHAATIAFGPGVGVVNFNQTDTFTLSTGITGGGSLVQRGTGMTILTGTAAHTGTTTVQAGTLLVNGSITSSPVTVASGATLGGSGTIGGLTTLQGGAHLALGVSPETLTFSQGLTLNDDAVLDLQLGTASDLIRISGGTLTGSPDAGGITLNLSDAGGFGAATYALIDFTGAALADFTASDFTLGDTIPGYNYDLAIVGNTLQLTTTPLDIPEPASVFFLGTGALIVAGTRRRRQQR